LPENKHYHNVPFLKKFLVIFDKKTCGSAKGDALHGNNANTLHTVGNSVFHTALSQTFSGKFLFG